MILNIFRKKADSKTNAAEETRPRNAVRLRIIEPTQKNIAVLKDNFVSVHIVTEDNRIVKIQASRYISGIFHGKFDEEISIHEEHEEYKLLTDFIGFVRADIESPFSCAALCFFDESTAAELRCAAERLGAALDAWYLNVGETVRRIYPFRGEKKYTPAVAYSFFGSIYRYESEQMTEDECVGRTVCLLTGNPGLAAALSRYNTFSKKKPERTITLKCAADTDIDHLDIGMEIGLQYNRKMRCEMLSANSVELSCADNETIKILSSKTGRKIIFITNITVTKKEVVVTAGIYPDLPMLPFGLEEKQKYRVRPKDSENLI
ncbi:MAG: hypothetical protein IJI14_08155 [Anaerolineaceae bacterium]|nr:hypothetical protein [Anaerolineaceae bacterium]